MKINLYYIQWIRMAGKGPMRCRLMDREGFFKDYRSFVSFHREHYGKSTLLENDHVLVGLNCLQPGQEMEKHAHQVQSRFYVVMEGRGCVWVGDKQGEAKAGMGIWVPACYYHRLVNPGRDAHG